MKKKSINSLIVTLMFFTISCGVVDTEQVSEIIAKKEEISQIRSQRIDPLINKISEIDNEIKPLENKVKTLEQEKKKLFSEMEKIQGEKVREIKLGFGELKTEDRALIDELKTLDRELQELKTKQGQEIKSANEKKFRDIKQEELQIKQAFEKFKGKKNQGPSAEIQAQIDKLTEEFEEKTSELQSNHKKKFDSLNSLSNIRGRELEDEYQAKYGILKERYEQLDKHRKNLSTQKKIANAQNQLDNANKRLLELGVGDEDETVESLEKQIADLEEQISQISEKITDPKWTEKLTDGSLKQGTPEYDNHIKNETKITNPEWSELNIQKNNKQNSLDRKNNNNNDERTQQQIVEYKERKEKSENDLAKYNSELEEIGISGVDTSEIDGEIKAIEAKVSLLEERILSFPESDKNIQDPNWTKQLLVLTDEVEKANQELIAAEEEVNSIEVFIPDTENPDALIQNPEYTIADEKYARTFIERSEKQQLYEAHIRNQGSILNPEYQDLINEKKESEDLLTQKQSEKDSLLVGGGSTGLPDSEAAISRERSAIKEKMEEMRKAHSITKKEVTNAVKDEVRQKQNEIRKEAKDEISILKKQQSLEIRNLKTVASKKPQELLDLEERMSALQKEKNSIKDQGDASKDELSAKADEMLAQRNVIRDKRDLIEDRRRILEDSRDEIGSYVEPVREEVKQIESEIKNIFIALSDFYDQKKETQKQLETIEREIEDLAREAESDILTLITDAMTAAEELESSNPLDFSQFEINLDEEESTE